MQRKAGYISDTVSKVITDKLKGLEPDNPMHAKIEGLLELASCYDVSYPNGFQLNYESLDPELAVIQNIITRGLPTRAPVELEELFCEVGLATRLNTPGELNYESTDPVLTFEEVFELLHIVEPGLSIDRKHYGGRPDSNAEWDFLDKKLGEFPFAKQILESQRDFQSIQRHMVGGRRVDYSFQFPYRTTMQAAGLSDHYYQGVIFEFDGPTHKLRAMQFYDEYRDVVAADVGFETFRQSHEQVQTNPAIEEQFRSDIFNVFSRNYKRSVENQLRLYTAVFVPLAVARIQKTVVDALLKKPDLLKQKVIQIGVKERDFPCSGMAIRSLVQLWSNLRSLQSGEGEKTPQLSVFVDSDDRFCLDPRLHAGAERLTSKEFAQMRFDISIDHSILRRFNVYKEDDMMNESFLRIRSAHYPDLNINSARKVYCAVPLRFKSLVKRKSDGAYETIQETLPPIQFILSELFRKAELREGQMPIISRALRQEPVVGLLPTGAGKSITYQLPAFLIPGLCLVIDPIKSLMEDQVRVLKLNRIDSCEYINSNLGREEKTKRLLRYQFGEYLFLFVSPERLVMNDFRKLVKNIGNGHFRLGFGQCVIDEVHCVSEWGHDFRSTYLMLGKNAQEWLSTRNGLRVNLIGLTATASFDVLADIERELQIQHDDVANAIIIIENTIRPELFFRVVDATEQSRMGVLAEEFRSLGVNLDDFNNPELIGRAIEHHKEEFDNDYSGGTKILITDLHNNPVETSNIDTDEFYTLVFCPVKGQGGHELGVDIVYKSLPTESKGYFYSADRPGDLAGDTIAEDVLRHFNGFISGRTHHMVCTKAFGMGIDKQDIRATYHFLYPPSLESFVQEAGRAGRDRKVAISTIIASKAQVHFFDVYTFFKENAHEEVITQRFTRKAIRAKFLRFWDADEEEFRDCVFESRDALINAIQVEDFSLINAGGQRYNVLSESDVLSIRKLMLQKVNREEYKYLKVRYTDRDTHHFFYGVSFKGADAEKSQMLDLFKTREYTYQGAERIYIEEQERLIDELDAADDGSSFDFIMTATKQYSEQGERICSYLGVSGNEVVYGNQTKRMLVLKAAKNSYDFDDFLLMLHENEVVNELIVDRDIRRKLLFVYNRNRPTPQDTGRLIYRMHSMGFLTDYSIDYNTGLYHCKFVKHVDIDSYLSAIHSFLQRYLSRRGADRELDKLKKRLPHSDLADQILECLGFLAEFAYEEIGGKRKRATDEIERIVVEAISGDYDETHWFGQNTYLKREIYFYFNAKYARREYQINGVSHFMDDDYRNDGVTRLEFLDKYLNALNEDGTAQNNYKHMIGSTRKILRNLTDRELNRDWALRLLKSFSMYAVNNVSYLAEANAELEMAIANLYRDEDFHGNRLEEVRDIMDLYLQYLELHLVNRNSRDAFASFSLIRLKVLGDMHSIALRGFLNEENREFTI